MTAYKMILLDGLTDLYKVLRINCMSDTQCDFFNTAIVILRTYNLLSR